MENHPWQEPCPHSGLRFGGNCGLLASVGAPPGTARWPMSSLGDTAFARRESALLCLNPKQPWIFPQGSLNIA
jgi:hypothetical protein